MDIGQIRTKARTTVEGPVFEGTITNRDFTHIHLFDANCKEARFEKCDFSYAIIDRSYFHKAEFVECKFVGCRFRESNFRNSTIDGCDFKYAQFQKTLIPLSEIERNLPEWPNVRTELLRNLRINYSELGDGRSANTLVRLEIKSELEHWRLARKAADGYYKRKYSGIRKRISVYWNTLLLQIDRFAWGHGEFLSRMILSLLVVLTGICVVVIVSSEIVSDTVNGPLFWQGAQEAVLYTLGGFLDVTYTASFGRFLWIEFILSGLRYLYLGLFISVLFRRISRR